jgi:hypothetical protein
MRTSALILTRETMDAPEDAPSCDAFPYWEQSAVFPIGGCNFFRLTGSPRKTDRSYRSSLYDSAAETSILDKVWRLDRHLIYNGINL